MSNTLTARQKRALINKILKVKTARDFAAKSAVGCSPAEFNQNDSDSCFLACMIEGNTSLKAGWYCDFLVSFDEIEIPRENSTPLIIKLPLWAEDISRAQLFTFCAVSVADLSEHFRRYSSRTLHSIFPVR